MASIIAGETGDLCGLEAKIAVGWVIRNREVAGITGGWAGRATPTRLDVAVAETYHKLADPTHGALVLVSAQDMQRADVRRLVAGREQTARFDCAGGLALEAWR